MDCFVSARTVWAFYRSRNITFRTGKAVYRQFVTQSERLLEERSSFAALIGNLVLARQDNLIYVDETTYASNSIPRRSWSSRDDPVLHQKNSKQMRRTVIGGIGRCLTNGRVMNLARSTNKAEFQSFLVDLKQAVLPKYRHQTQIVLFDGARAHTCRDTLQFFEGMFIPLQIPRFSCDFNCPYPSIHPSLSVGRNDGQL